MRIIGKTNIVKGAYTVDKLTEPLGYEAQPRTNHVGIVHYPHRKRKLIEIDDETGKFK